MGSVPKFTDVEKPELDDREYRIIELPNKLEALLIHDAETDKASASLSVNVGSFKDPEDMPGMAHAVEHLLFMGTKKYPIENAYSSYLSEHSGHSNAYTAETETNYYFEVDAGQDHHEQDAADSTGRTDINGSMINSSNTGLKQEPPLYGALDRFAQFFVEPLFLEDTLDRELRAVDSENKKNLQSDTWRLIQLDRSLSNPKHPNHKFSTGNLATLRDEPRERGLEIRSEFIKFYTEHYSSNRMKLVVLGKESLDTLENWVTGLFSDIENKDLPENRWDDVPLYSKDELLTQTFAKPVMETRSLEVFFPAIEEENLYEASPTRYISHLIGHEGPGSIFAYIKAKGWANGLSSGARPICPGASVFIVSVQLTPEGFKQYQEVAKTIFQYIATLKAHGPQAWIADEVIRMNEVDFRFKQKKGASRTTSHLSGVMQHHQLPRKWLLSGSRSMRCFDPDTITEALSYFNEDNFRIQLVSQEAEGLDRREKWYGTEYRYEEIPQHDLKMFRDALRGANVPSELHLPSVNEFIPAALDVEKINVNEPAKAPKLIRNTVGIRTWWKKDDRFWAPKANVFVTLRSPLVHVTPANVVKGKFYIDLIRDSLKEYSYDADIAGLEYTLDTNVLGLSIRLSGYNDKMEVLLKKVLESIRYLEIKDDRFMILKEKLKRSYRNFGFQQPYRQIIEYSNWLTSARTYTKDELLGELDPITADDIRAFYPQVLQQVHAEILVHGNMYKEEALRLSDLIDQTLRSKPLPASQWYFRRSLIPLSGSNRTYRRLLKDPANINNCVEQLTYISDITDMKLRAAALLLAQLTEEPSFDQLRTKEQLGYIVFAGVRLGAATISYRVLVQSERSVEYLEERINAFLAMFGENLKKMSQEQFDGLKRSCINSRLEKVKNLNQESERFAAHIVNEYYSFFQVDVDVEHLRPLTKGDMIEFFDHYIHPTSEHRTKLSVHLVAQAAPEEAAASLDPAAQKEKAISLLQKFLTSEGIQVMPGALSGRFNSIDLSNCSQEELIAALSSFLIQDAKIERERATEILDKAVPLLQVGLKGLGIEVQSSSRDQELPPAPKVKLTTYIDDVYQYRRDLPLSKGPRPLVDFSEFEDFEAKL